MLTRAMLALALVCGFALAPSTARSPSAWADTTSDAGVVDAGSAATTPATVTTTTTTTTAEAVPNPVKSPAAAWDDAKAAKKTSWPLLVWLLLVMLGKALAYGRVALKGVPVVGKLAARLAVGKAAMVVAAIGAIGAAGYDVLVSGGSWVAALVASGAALGGVLHSTTQPPATPAT